MPRKGNNKFKFDLNKLGKSFARKAHFKKKYKPKPKGNRGFWPVHQFIRRDDLVHELNVKNSLKPNGGIDVHKIDDMSMGKVTLEEELLRREKAGEKFNSRDTIRLKNYHEKMNNLIMHDINSLQTLDGIVNSRPVTVEGRFYKKMKILERFYRSNNKKKIAHMYLKIQDDEDDLDTMNFEASLKDEFNDLLQKVNKKVSTYDMVDLQLNELSNFVTPLNITGFKKLEDFQIDVIKHIQENEKKPIEKKNIYSC